MYKNQVKMVCSGHCIRLQRRAHSHSLMTNLASDMVFSSSAESLLSSQIVGTNVDCISTPTHTMIRMYPAPLRSPIAPTPILGRAHSQKHAGPIHHTHTSLFTTDEG